MKPIYDFIPVELKVAVTVLFATAFFVLGCSRTLDEYDPIPAKFVIQTVKSAPEGYAGWVRKQDLIIGNNNRMSISPETILQNKAPNGSRIEWMPLLYLKMGREHHVFLPQDIDIGKWNIGDRYTHFNYVTTFKVVNFDTKTLEQMVKEGFDISKLLE